MPKYPSVLQTLNPIHSYPEHPFFLFAHLLGYGLQKWGSLCQVLLGTSTKSELNKQELQKRWMTAE